MVEKERARERRRFVIVKPTNSFIARSEIKAQRLGGIDANEQIRNLITNQPNKKTNSGTPEYLAVETTQEQFLSSAKKTLESPDSNVARECFKSLILIAPEAEATSDTIDETTGIRIVKIKKGAIRFPTHPTPNS